MNAVSKVLIVLVFVMSVGFAVSEMILFSKRENYGNAYKDARAQLLVAQEDVQKANGQINDLKQNLTATEASLTGERDSLKTQLDASQAEVARLDASNRDQGDNIQSLTDSNNQLSARNLELSGTIDQQKTTIAERDEAIKGHLDDVAKLQATLADRNGTIDDLQFNLTETKKVLHTTTLHNEELQSILGELAARGVQIPPTPLPIINARVVRVDPEHGVAVVDKGKDAGVKQATQFTIYDDEGYIGRLIIDNVQPEVSAGRIEQLRPGAEVRQGNKATTQVP